LKCCKLLSNYLSNKTAEFKLQSSTNCWQPERKLTTKPQNPTETEIMDGDKSNKNQNKKDNLTSKKSYYFALYILRKL